MPAERSPGAEHINPDALGLALRFSDGFDSGSGALDHFDLTHWMKWQGDARTANGHAILSAAATPGEWGDAGICTREKHFNPGLRGTNGVEVTFIGHAQQGGSQTKQHPEHIGNPLAGPYITGMCLTAANCPGPLLPDAEADGDSDHDEQGDSDFMSSYRASGQRRSGRRGVQIHFDWMSKWGLDYFLCRSIVPEDYRRYPEWDVRLDSLEEFAGRVCRPSRLCGGMMNERMPHTEDPRGKTHEARAQAHRRCARWLHPNVISSRCLPSFHPDRDYR